MLKRIFGNKKQIPADLSKNQSKEKVLLENFIEKYNNANVLDERTKDLVADCILKGEKYIFISSEKRKELDNNLKNKKIIDKKMSSVISLNNEGIALEKSGQIELAIKTYEKCIETKYSATHAYERLMILYRKKKDYQNEIRVIQVALEVFALTNELRLERALTESTDIKEKESIKKGYQSCRQVKNKEGWVIFNPYPVEKYAERLLKSESLMSKMK